MTNTELLEEKIKQSGLKKGFIAKKIGVAPNTLTALINNKSEFKVKQMRTICEILQISDEEEIHAIFFN